MVQWAPTRESRCGGTHLSGRRFNQRKSGGSATSHSHSGQRAESFTKAFSSAIGTRRPSFERIVAVNRLRVPHKQRIPVLYLSRVLRVPWLVPGNYRGCTNKELISHRSARHLAGVFLDRSRLEYVSLDKSDMRLQLGQLDNGWGNMNL